MNTTKIIFTTCFCLAKAMFSDAENVSLDSLSQRKAADEYIESRVNSLQEVVVKGHRRMFCMKNGVLTTQVSGTTLADEPSLYEVLTRIPGMVKTADGSLEVFGLGAPDIYINGKKATKTQLSALDVRQIDDIRLLTSPGAKYDATTGAVLEIRTHRRNPGYFANVSGTYKASKMNSHNESITTGYADNRFSLSANYSFSDSRYAVHQPQWQTLNMPDGAYNYWSDRNGRNKSRTHQGAIEAEWTLGKHTVGVSWEGSRTRGGRHEWSGQHYQILEESEKVFHADGTQDATSYFQHVNLFHQAQYGKRLSGELYLDYAKTHGNGEQPVAEAEDGTTAIVSNNSKTAYDVYGARGQLSLRLSDNHTLTAGAEYGFVEGGGTVTSDAEAVSPADYGNRENTVSLFAEYVGSIGKWGWNAGLRFEHLSSRYFDHIDRANDISRDYDQLFPSAGVSYNGGKWRHSLTFRTTTARPSFLALSSATYYVNRFFYQMGNPQLKHQNSYSLEWRTQWKDFIFSARYDRTNDLINNFLDATATKPYSVVSTYGNYDNISDVLASLYWSHTYGVWQPELNGAFIRQFFSVSYMGKPLSCDGNTWNVSFSNTFRITETFTATLNYFFCNGGMARYVKLKPYQYFAAGLTKTFLDRRLAVAFRAFDIFHQYLFRERGRVGVVDFTQTEDYKSWNYSLTVTFRLNSNKGKYNGQNSAKELINRL